MRRNRSAEVTEITFGVIIILLCILLFLFHEDYPVLFPVVFGTAALYCVFRVFEAVRFGTNRKEKSTGGVLFGALTLILVGIAYVAVRVFL
ncbi:MAG: hypothetical protein IJL43_01020 [Lachnospiraceae bacterium]|nr:hypothetical protein [Lachnospiraceae bacterium]